MRNVWLMTVVVLCGLAAPAPAWAYIGSFPTLGKGAAEVVRDAATQALSRIRQK